MIEPATSHLDLHTLMLLNCCSARDPPTQVHMNKAWQGPQFNISTRIPFTLALLSICMVLAPALPILYSIAFAGVAITTFLDK